VPAHKSLVAQQAPSDYFLIRNLKYHLRGTSFIDDESLKIAVEAWFESRNRKLFSRHKQPRRKVKKCTDVSGKYAKNDSMRDIIY